MWPLAVLMAALPLISAAGRFHVSEPAAVWGLSLQPLLDGGSETPLAGSPPLMRWILAAIDSLLGPFSPYSVLLTAGVSTLAMLLGVYWFCSRLADDRIALMTVLFAALQPETLRGALEPTPGFLAAALGMWASGECIRHVAQSDEVWEWSLFRSGIALGLCALAGGWQVLVWSLLMGATAWKQRELRQGVSPLEIAPMQRSRPFVPHNVLEWMLSLTVPFGLAAIMIGGWFLLSREDSAREWSAAWARPSEQLFAPFPGKLDQSVPDRSVTSGRGTDRSVPGGKDVVSLHADNALATEIADLSVQGLVALLEMAPLFALAGFGILASMPRRNRLRQTNHGPAPGPRNADSSQAVNAQPFDGPLYSLLSVWLLLGAGFRVFELSTNSVSGPERVLWIRGSAVIPLCAAAAIGWCACAQRIVSATRIGLVFALTALVALAARAVYPRDAGQPPLTSVALFIVVGGIGMALIASRSRLAEIRVRELLAAGLVAILLAAFASAVPTLRPIPRSNSEFEEMCSDLRALGAASRVTMISADHLDERPARLPASVLFALRRTWPNASFQEQTLADFVAATESGEVEPARDSVPSRHLAVVWSRTGRPQLPASRRPVSRVGATIFFAGIELTAWVTGAPPGDVPPP
jgi:hypothetical protein